MVAGELAQRPADQFFPAALTGLDTIVDQFELLLVQSQPYRRFRHEASPCEADPRAIRGAGICFIVTYGVQPFGACMPDLLIEFRFAIVTGTSGTSSFFFSSGFPFTSASIIWTAERPIMTGCCATM